MPLSLLYPAGNKLYDATNTFFGLNPGSTVCAARKLRMKSPEQTSSSDSAICATPSALESRAFLTLPVLAPESSFSTAIGERSLARIAGSTPNITPASSEIKNVTSSTVPFAEIFSTIGIPDGGINRENDPAVQAVISIASPPASTASSVLSTKNCRTTRQRVAPTESRIAISRRRPTLRTKIRFATFAHASSNTNPEIAISIGNSTYKYPFAPNGPRQSGYAVTTVSLLCSLGNSAPRRDISVVMSACACSGVTPGFKRPCRISQFTLRSASRSYLETTWPCIVTGTHI